jgi:hypothetical protein
MLEKLADLLTNLEDEKAIVEYLRALQAKGAEPGSLLSNLMANAGRELFSNMLLDIDTGGQLRFDTKELEKIYIPGYRAFVKLSAFLRTHDRLWARITFHASKV